MNFYKKKELKGALALSKVKSIEGHGKNEYVHLNFRLLVDFDGEWTFHLWAETTIERDKWLKSIEFLKDIEEKISNEINWDRTTSESSYFNVEDKSWSSSETFKKDQGKVKESWRLDNLDKESIESVAADKYNEMLLT